MSFHWTIRNTTFIDVSYPKSSKVTQDFLGTLKNLAGKLMIASWVSLTVKSVPVFCSNLKKKNQNWVESEQQTK